MCILFVVASMSAFSLTLLVDCNMLGQANSYLEVASAAFGQRGTKAVQLTMFLLTFGAMTVYVGSYSSI